MLLSNSSKTAFRSLVWKRL